MIAGKHRLLEAGEAPSPEPEPLSAVRAHVSQNGTAGPAAG